MTDMVFLNSVYHRVGGDLTVLASGNHHGDFTFKWAPSLYVKFCIGVS